ncbi:hypothetical protein ACQKWADRAFT_224497 [Trichoderma austrokoningii]
MDESLMRPARHDWLIMAKTNANSCKLPMSPRFADIDCSAIYFPASANPHRSAKQHVETRRSPQRAHAANRQRPRQQKGCRRLQAGMMRWHQDWTQEDEAAACATEKATSSSSAATDAPAGLRRPLSGRHDSRAACACAFALHGAPCDVSFDSPLAFFSRYQTRLLPLIWNPCLALLLPLLYCIGSFFYYDYTRRPAVWINLGSCLSLWLSLVEPSPHHHHCYCILASPITNSCQSASPSLSCHSVASEQQHTNTALLSL